VQKEIILVQGTAETIIIGDKPNILFLIAGALL